MMESIYWLSRRPFILVLMLYCALLIVLNNHGFFSQLPENHIAHYAPASKITVTGIITTFPEIKTTVLGQSLVFTIDAVSCNGKTTQGAVLIYTPLPASLSPGDHVTVSGKLVKPRTATNPGSFDYRSYLSYQNIHVLLYAKQCSRSQQAVWYDLRSQVYRLRTHLQQQANRFLSPRFSTLLTTMIIGGKYGLTQNDKQPFIDAGVMHVLVVSGLHVGYWVLFIWWILRLCALPYRASLVIAIPCIWLYVLLTGVQAPVMRSGIMASVIIITAMLNRETDIYQSLALAAGIILIVNPRALFTASFQLSFSATAGIIYLYPRLYGALIDHLLPSPLPFMVKYLIQLAVISLSAQLAVSPFLVYFFNRLSLIGIISNLFMVPLGGIIIIIGFGALMVSSVAPFLGHFIFFPVSLALWTFTTTAEACARFPYAVIHLPSPPLGGLILYFALLWLLVQKTIYRHWKKLIIFLGIITIVSIASYWHHTADTIITFLDIGYGNAIHLRLPGNIHWFIDAGGSYNPRFDVAQRTVIPYLHHQGIKRIDKLFITSQRWAHYGAVGPLMETIPINQIILPPDTPWQEEYRSLITSASVRGISVTTAHYHDRWMAGPHALRVISPYRQYKRSANNSLVLLFEAYGHTCLFTGNLSEYQQQMFLKYEPLPPITLLQLPPRKKTDFPLSLLQAIHPRYAITPASKPPESILEDSGIDPATTLWSLRESGSVQVAVKKKQITVRVFRSD